MTITIAVLNQPRRCGATRCSWTSTDKEVRSTRERNGATARSCKVCPWRKSMVAIVDRHRAARVALPSNDPSVRDVLAGIRARRGTRPRAKAPLASRDDQSAADGAARRVCVIERCVSWAARAGANLAEIGRVTRQASEGRIRRYVRQGTAFERGLLRGVLWVGIALWNHQSVYNRPGCPGGGGDCSFWARSSRK